MKERPILFNGEMVRAILEGRKTQTRRVVKFPIYDPDYKCELAGCELNSESENFDRICPYGAPGERLWVRETFTLDGGMVFYRADREKAKDDDSPWTPSIHMPRWASRITLEVKNVRVERVQDISEADARAEGVEASTWCELMDGSPSYVPSFRELWERTYGIDNPKAWDTNPWVWVVEFEVIEDKTTLDREC